MARPKAQVDGEEAVAASEEGIVDASHPTRKKKKRKAPDTQDSVVSESQQRQQQQSSEEQAKRSKRKTGTELSLTERLQQLEAEIEEREGKGLEDVAMNEVEETKSSGQRRFYDIEKVQQLIESNIDTLIVRK